MALQYFNLGALRFTLSALWHRPTWMVPHLKVRGTCFFCGRKKFGSDVGDIRYSKLKERGIKAVIFDKDNTLTAPYAAEWYSSRIADCIRDCQDEFGVQNVAICSNTVGSRKDRTKHNYAGAEEIQVIMGVKVVRHELNKPLTPVSDIIDHFQSFREGEVGQTRFLQPHEIAVIGDRYVGDILWGNSQGFLTIKTEPLTFVGENFAVRLARMAENGIQDIFRMLRKEPPNHPLVGDIAEFTADLTFPPMRL